MHARSYFWRKKRLAESPEYRRKTLEYSRAYYIANRTRINARRRHRWATDAQYRERHLSGVCSHSRRRSYLKHLYGISLEQYNAMWAQQGGACAICERRPGRTLAVDHCHATGIVRGLLCAKCNAGLGCYDDESSLMLKAIAYLKASRGNR